ncbi:hypothetical protein CK203_021798 [Vitis vinifera]|uniref:Ubiquitin-like protease family profile domain-containing protein n=1 Tax=Vitis vinifera TaxID=29760 RepID=A0A438JFW0_VITVI|nr:hypothetical protein CK203_021798 [Vitis vinifera]
MRSVGIGTPDTIHHQLGLGPSMFTRCSAARFKKIYNRLPEEKIQAIRDLQFGGLLNLNCIEVTSTSSEHPFGTIRACEEKLFNLPVGEEFCRAFIYYACATLLASTSRLNGCRNLWHTIHEDGFRNELHYVIKFQIPSVQVLITVPPALAWTNDLIKRRLAAEIKEFGAFRHAEASQRSPTVERTMEAETNVDHDTNIDAENSDWGKFRCCSHSGYAPTNTPTADDHAFLGDEDMALHGADHVIYTPDCIVAPEYELQPSVPINAVSDGEEQPEGNVVPINKNVRKRRVFLPVLIKNHWTLYVYDLSNKKIQLLDSRPSRKKTTLSGIQQNLAKVILWLAAHKKEVSPYDLRTFNFLTPDVPLQPNEHDCRVFVMKFMELSSMGGFSKSIDEVRRRNYL